VTRQEAITEETRRYLYAIEGVSLSRHFQVTEGVTYWRHRAHIHWLALSRLRSRAPWDLDD